VGYEFLFISLYHKLIKNKQNGKSKNIINTKSSRKTKNKASWSPRKDENIKNEEFKTLQKGILWTRIKKTPLIRGFFVLILYSTCNLLGLYPDFNKYSLNSDSNDFRSLR
jgi:uncharacterized protein YqhQ